MANIQVQIMTDEKDRTTLMAAWLIIINNSKNSKWTVELNSCDFEHELRLEVLFKFFHVSELALRENIDFCLSYLSMSCGVFFLFGFFSSKILLPHKIGTWTDYLDGITEFLKMKCFMQVYFVQQPIVRFWILFHSCIYRIQYHIITYIKYQNCFHKKGITHVPKRFPGWLMECLFCYKS